MICPRCRKNKAVYNYHYGYLPCNKCLSEESTPPRRSVEFTTNSIKDSRQEYRRDILQPWDGDTLSKEYLEEYGTQGVQATDDQIKNAKYTHKGIKGWWNRDKSKGGKHK